MTVIYTGKMPGFFPSGAIIMQILLAIASVVTIVMKVMTAVRKSADKLHVTESLRFSRM